MLLHEEQYSLLVKLPASLHGKELGGGGRGARDRVIGLRVVERQSRSTGLYKPVTVVVRERHGHEPTVAVHTGAQHVDAGRGAARYGGRKWPIETISCLHTEKTWSVPARQSTERHKKSAGSVAVRWSTDWSTDWSTCVENGARSRLVNLELFT